MNYSDLVDNKASEKEIRAFLTGGETTAITFRIPKNLKESVSEVATLRGISFSAFIRACLMEELAKPCYSALQSNERKH